MDQLKLIEKLFSPGSRVYVDYVDEKNEINNCSTIIEDLEGIYLVMQAPLVNGVSLIFRESQELTLRRLDAREEEAYITNVFVIDIRQDKIPLLVCSKPHKIDKTSLRRFSRFKVMLPLKYQSDEGISGAGSVNDLSLTGCYALINLNRQVQEGTVLNLTVSIPDEADLIIKGKIIRVDSLTGKGQVGLAIDYHDITDAMKEVIYNYIFQLQLTSERYFGIRADSEDH